MSNNLFSVLQSLNWLILCQTSFKPHGICFHIFRSLFQAFLPFATLFVNYLSALRVTEFILYNMALTSKPHFYLQLITRLYFHPWNYINKVGNQYQRISWNKEEIISHYTSKKPYADQLASRSNLERLQLERFSYCGLQHKFQFSYNHTNYCS